MPKFSNGKITTSAIFYNRGIPANDKSFGTYASLNYEVLKQFKIYNKRQGFITNKRRQIYSLF